MKNTITITFLVLCMSLIPIAIYAQSVITYYAIINSTHSYSMQSTGNTLYGELLDTDSVLTGSEINKLSVKLQRVNNPSGNITAGVWANGVVPTYKNFKYALGNMSALSVTTTAGGLFYTFTNDNSTYTLQTGDIVGIYYDGASGTNSISIYAELVTTSSPFDGGHTRGFRYNVGTGFGNATGACCSDMTMIMSLVESDSPTQGIDCTDPQNANILICRLGGTGAFGSAGNFIIGHTPTNGTGGTGIVGIGCGIGIVDCVSDPDIKTNGLGILIFISSIFIVVGMFMTTQGAEKTFKIPTYIWIIIIIALSAFFTLTNVIDPVFLIVSIIALIALASPRLVSMFGGGSNSFGSGSTE